MPRAAFRQELVARQVELRAGLSGLGDSLVEPIVVIGDRAEVNIGQITAAQTAYDAAPER